MPYKDKEKRDKYMIFWRNKNREKINTTSMEYYNKNREHCLLVHKIRYHKFREGIIIRRKKMLFENPWRSHHYSAKNRCLNPNCKNYNTYGGRGIQFLLTMDETKELWLRDKANLFKRPTIDKINNNGNYEFSNCRFIEQSENSTKGNYETRWKKNLIPTKQK